MDDPACVTGIDVHPLQEALTVYPNPFQSDFYIGCDCRERLSYQLFNTMGSIVLEGEADFSKGSVRISEENLAEGMYLLQIRDGYQRSVVSRYLVRY